MSKQNRTFLVSNRMPVTVALDESGPVLKKSSGGLVTALNPVHDGSKCFWVGYLGGTFEITPELGALFEQQRFIPVEIDEVLYSDYYNGMANGSIWPLFHYFPGMAEFNEKYWKSYCEVNEIFANRVAELLEPDDTVWVHDYQLMLLPELIRQRRPDVQIGYFHHIPFPASEILKIFPWRHELIRGLLGADVVGFHTLEYARHFSSASARLVGCETIAEDIYHGDRVIKTGAFPLGIDVTSVQDALKDPEHIQKYEDLRRNFSGKYLIFGVDRLDYTKGIKERLLAYEVFLEENPEFARDTVFIQMCVPSRTEVRQYNELRTEIESMVGRINGQYGSPVRTPVQYLFRSVGLAELTALFRRADIGFVTPLRDGLNLVCKEYVECHPDLDGMLILSEFAGAAEEMGEALLVNPFDVNQTAAAIRRAITMPTEEKTSRMRVLRERVHEFNNIIWANSFLEILADAVDRNRSNKSKAIDPGELKNIEYRLSHSERALLAFSYEAIFDKPVQRFENPSMQNGAIDLIQFLSAHPALEILLVSTKTREKCNRIFDGLDCWVAAENGSFVGKNGTGEWVSLNSENSLDPFEPEIMRILGRCVRRVPGSLIELQETSILWHFRQAGGAFARGLALETSHSLNHMLNKSGFQCVMGRSALEIRSGRIHPGHALEAAVASMNLPDHAPIITFGDNKMDQELFRACSERNTSISLGLPSAFSHYTISNYNQLETILQSWIGVGPLRKKTF